MSILFIVLQLYLSNHFYVCSEEIARRMTADAMENDIEMNPTLESDPFELDFYGLPPLATHSDSDDSHSNGEETAPRLTRQGTAKAIQKRRQQYTNKGQEINDITVKPTHEEAGYLVSHFSKFKVWLPLPSR